MQTLPGRSIVAVCLLLGSAAAAQERPFLFSANPDTRSEIKATLHYDVGYGQRVITPIGHDGFDHNVGLQARLGRRFTFLGRVGTSASGDGGTFGQAELLMSLLGSRPTGPRLGVGLGVLREREGTNVLLGRVAAAHLSERWRLDVNLALEKPLTSNRDAADVITTLGFARRVRGAVYLGVEAIGEDLEGFWEADEAEGGAKLMVGPSLRVAPAGRRWQLALAGGPVVYATRSGRLSPAERALAGVPTRNGYIVRSSISYVF